MGRFWGKAEAGAAFISLFAMLLTGCGWEQPQVVREQQAEEISITLLASQNWIKDIDRQLFREFQEETGIEVELLLTPDNRYESLLGTCMAGGSGAIDIFMSSAGEGYLKSGIGESAVDLSEEPWAGKLEEWAKNACSYDGKVVGFSTWGIDYEGILYNRTYFAEHDLEVPDTWQEFLTLCDSICELGAVPLYEGINSSWHTRCWVDGLTPALYQEIPELTVYLNEGPQHKFADLEAFRKGMEQIYGLFRAQENGRPKYYISDGNDEGFQGSYLFLAERKAVMMFTYSAYAAELKAYGSKDEWGMFPVPLLDNRTAVSNGGGIAKFISKNSSHIEECKSLFEFLARQENLERYYEARTDFVTSAFQEVKAVRGTDATEEILERSKEMPPVMYVKEVFYLNPDISQYLRGFADGTCSVEEFICAYDEYRERVFESRLHEKRE